jgi:endoglucanase
MQVWWTGSTDNVGTTSYEVFRNGVSAGTFPSNVATIVGLSPLTTYSLTVRARDAVGNWSLHSHPVAMSDNASGAAIGSAAEIADLMAGNNYRQTGILIGLTQATLD